MKIAQLFLAALALLLVGIVAAQTGQQPQSAETAIKARAATFAAAWNKHDSKALAACWTADGDLIDPFGQSTRGRAEIEKFFSGEHAGVMKDTTYTITRQTVRMLGDDVAVVDWDSDVTGMKEPDGAPAAPLKHHVTIVLTQDGEAGDWLFVAARPVIYALKPAAAQ